MMKNLSLLLFLCLSVTSASLAQNCSVNANADKTLCLGMPINLQGFASSPSDPNTIQWSLVSQPSGAAIVIDNPNSFATTTSGTIVPGSYVFALKIKCGDGLWSNTDQVTYTINDVPATPTISANPYYYTCYNPSSGNTFTLTGSSVPSGSTASWSLVQGYGTFSSTNTASTVFTPSINPGDCATSTSSIVVKYTITNSSGCSKSITTTLSLYGINYGAVDGVIDPVPPCSTCTNGYGTCPGSGSPLWTVVNKPATAPAVSFNPSAASRNVNICNLVPGSYTIRYSVTGGCIEGSKEFTFEVKQGGVALADAGPNQYYCDIPSTISLTGSTPGSGQTASWTQIFGGTSTITSPSSPTTTVTGLSNAGATYTYLYTIANTNGCKTSDTVNIYRIPRLNLTANNIVSCSNTDYPSDEIAYFGDFNYRGLDTVTARVTYLSGPGVVDLATTVQFSTSGYFGSYNMIYPTPNYTVYGVSPGATLTTPIGLSNGLINNNAYSAYRLLSTVNYNSPLIAGIYRFKVSYETKCETLEKEVTIYKGYTYNSLTLSNAGTDQMLACGVTTTQLAGNLPTGMGTWETYQVPSGASNPLPATQINNQYPQLTNLQVGLYRFLYYRVNGPSCMPLNVDTVSLLISSNIPTAPTLAATGTICPTQYTYTGASAIPAGALATWSLVSQSPAGTAPTISGANTATPTFTGLLPSTTYTFKYKLENGCGTAENSMSFTTTSSSGLAKPEIYRVGDGSGNGSSNCYQPYLYGGNSDYTRFAIPTSYVTSSMTFNWEIITSPNPMTGATLTTLVNSAIDINVNVTNITRSFFYSVIVTVTDATNCGTQTFKDTMTVFVPFEGNILTTSPNAGSAITLCSVPAGGYPVSTTLNGSPNTYPVKWQFVNSTSGQAPTITNPSLYNTSVSFPAPGNYTFKYGPDFGGIDPVCNFYLTPSYLTVVVADAPSVAYAGTDISYCNATGSTSLSANTITGGTGQWMIYDVIAGSSPVIASPSSPTTGITFPSSGIVDMKWVAYGTNPNCGPASSDIVRVTYIAPAKASNDQTLCGATSTGLSALNPSPGVGVWSLVSGPNTPTIADVNSNQTTVSGLVTGTYTFRYTVSDATGGCVTSDDVVITVSSVPTADAGVDFLSCSGGTNVIEFAATPAGTGNIGTWSVVSVPTGVAYGTFFSDIHSPTARYNGVTTPGTYIFKWSVSNGSCTKDDFVTVTAGSTACVLPVSLINFTAVVDDKCDALLTWEVASEVSLSKYIIEYSSNGYDFKPIGEKRAVYNNQAGNYKYYFTTPIENAKSFFRLKSLDMDGKYAYSGVLSLSAKCALKNKIEVRPNLLSKGSAMQIIIFSLESDSYANVKVYDQLGRVVKTMPIALASGSNTCNISQQLASGSYNVVLYKNDHSVLCSTKIVVE